MFFLFKAYYGYRYDYIPYPVEIKSYQDKLVTYYLNENHSEEKANDLATADVQNFLIKVYIKATTTNMKENERKLKYLRLCGWSLSAVLLAAVMAYLPYFIGLKI
ncbi:hypothetical protein ON064_16430 [Planococcus sp. A6]|uniref:hypothetical protein n=1 Tax=Planococcus sp. A6 TaxID=2992760 RepID=UPI00237AF469|nr:hypothetical protein [Planococcus sp. A6]MDE0584614.1 hypothetical protein [Planococcus sp. A6]